MDNRHRYEFRLFNLRIVILCVPLTNNRFEAQRQLEEITREVCSRYTGEPSSEVIAAMQEEIAYRIDRRGRELFEDHRWADIPYSSGAHMREWQEHQQRLIMQQLVIPSYFIEGNWQIRPEPIVSWSNDED